MNIRTLGAILTIPLAGAIEASAQPADTATVECAATHDPALIKAQKSAVLIEGVIFELRPQALELYANKPEPFLLLARALNAYGPYLSPENRIERFWVGDPDEVCGGSTTRFPHVLAFGYGDIDSLWYKDHPDLMPKHLLQIFLHEFGHLVAAEKNNLAFVEPIYWKAYLATPKNAEMHPLFELFMDNEYEAVNDGCGHPNNSAEELFASTFMLTLMYQNELERRIASSPKSIRVPARRLYDHMRQVTAKFPRPQSLLAKRPR